MRSPQWCSSPKALSLETQQIHLWRADLNRTASSLKYFWSLLCGDEQDRARRFRSPTDQNAFVAARGILRTLLGRYLQASPQTLQFCYGAYGKPALARLDSVNLCFNLSHSGGLALYAIALAQVGVDIEQVRPNLNQSAIAKRFFTPVENTFLAALPEGDRTQAFFKLWTCKEAYTKAKGEGIFQGLNQPEFSDPGFLAINQSSANLAPRQTWLKIDLDPQAPWFVAQLNPGPGYTAALAVADHPSLIQCWQWE